jgi:hypothetical protein
VDGLFVDAAGVAFVLADDHGGESFEEDVLLAEQVVLLHLPPALLPLLLLVLLAVPRRLQVVSRTVGTLLQLVLVVVVVAVDDRYQFLQFLPGLHPRRRDLLVADVQQVLGVRLCTLRVSSVSII